MTTATSADALPACWRFPLKRHFSVNMLGSAIKFTLDLRKSAARPVARAGSSVLSPVQATRGGGALPSAVRSPCAQYTHKNHRCCAPLMLGTSFVSLLWVTKVLGEYLPLLCRLRLSLRLFVLDSSQQAVRRAGHMALHQPQTTSRRCVLNAGNSFAYECKNHHVHGQQASVAAGTIYIRNRSRSPSFASPAELP